MAYNLFVNHCENLELKNEEISENDFKNISNLTPGDFAAVIRQNRFRKIKSAHDLFQRLEDEVNLKNASKASVLGFMS